MFNQTSKRKSLGIQHFSRKLFLELLAKSVFRDDIVFVVYLYQRYLYPVDKARVNEFGESFDQNDSTTTTTKEEETKKEK